MRLFVAIDPPEDVRGRLAALRGGVAGARWVPAGQIHLTLRFLGEVGEPAADEIARSLEEVREEDFPMELAGVGRFPPRRAPRVLWVGVKSEPRLFSLHEAVERRLADCGVAPEDKPFSPHVTLARLRDGASAPEVERWLERGRDFLAGPFRVGRFFLYSSVLGPGGASHERERAYDLA